MGGRVVILGCGASGGVPRPGGPDGAGEWGACDPSEPKNRRTRCSILVQGFKTARDRAAAKATNVLVDTAPDMRQQLLAAHCAHIDTVFYTHDHADQCHGIDDLRAFALQMRRRIPVYIDPHTAQALLDRFSYCFKRPAGSFYPPILDNKVMPASGDTVRVDGPGGGVPCTPFHQDHGPVDSLGFRFGSVAYSSDVVGLPEESFEVLAGVDVWIVDALQYEPHATHAHLDLTLEWIERVKPRLAVLTNLHIHMDYDALVSSLPSGVVPAYDGMTIEAEF